MRLYTPEYAARFLGLTESSLNVYVGRRLRPARWKDGEPRFEMDELQKYRREHMRLSKVPKACLRDVVDARYGIGIYDRLFAGEESYDTLAQTLDMTRQGVRELRKKVCPDAPKKSILWRHALERKQMQKYAQQLAADKMYQFFFSKASQFFQPEELQPIQLKQSSRVTAVSVRTRKVLLRKATRISSAVWQLTTPYEDCDFVFYKLRNSGYLLVPKEVLPEVRAAFTDTSSSKYYPFKHTFAVLSRRRRAS